MEALTLDGHMGRSVGIDVCHACQAFWFDGYESLQLSAASVLRLFRVIGDAGGSRVPLSADAACPRCQRRLKPIRDQQRQTRFEYRGCPERHGRLISFFNFLREKNFIKPLSPAQIETLRKTVQSVNCSNCGAPVDLAKGTACAHCGSPLSMLDVGQAQVLIEQLQKAGHGPHAQVTSLPLDLERARRDVAAKFEAFEHDTAWLNRASTGGLVEAAIGAFVRWIT